MTTETFDAVLAEMLAIAESDGCATDWRIRDWADRLAAAHAAEVAELRKDRDRLDWLADKDNPIGNVQLPTVCVMSNLDSMRGAIDEAMRLDPELFAAIATTPAQQAQVGGGGGNANP